LYGGEVKEGGEEMVVMDPMDVPWEKKLDKVFGEVRLREEGIILLGGWGVIRGIGF